MTKTCKEIISVPINEEICLGREMKNEKMG